MTSSFTKNAVLIGYHTAFQPLLYSGLALMTQKVLPTDTVTKTAVIYAVALSIFHTSYTLILERFEPKISKKLALGSVMVCEAIALLLARRCVMNFAFFPTNTLCFSVEILTIAARTCMRSLQTTQN